MWIRPVCVAAAGTPLKNPAIFKAAAEDCVHMHLRRLEAAEPPPTSFASLSSSGQYLPISSGGEYLPMAIYEGRGFWEEAAYAHRKVHVYRQSGDPLKDQVYQGEDGCFRFVTPPVAPPPPAMSLHEDWLDPSSPMPASPDPYGYESPGSTPPRVRSVSKGSSESSQYKRACIRMSDEPHTRLQDDPDDAMRPSPPRADSDCSSTSSNYSRACIAALCRRADEN